MKNVMTRAWEIAKEGVAKFGGKAKEYFAQALVIAWEEVKGAVKMVEKIILIADKDNMVYHVYGERNGKVFRKRENLNDAQMKEAYGYLAAGLGINTMDRYMIENGAK